LLAFLLISKISHSSERITWYINHSPPAYILTGQNKGQGYVDRILKLVIDKLPQYQHQIISATTARALHDMRSGKQACDMTMFKTAERENSIEFSLSSLMSPSLHLIISKTQANTLKLKSNVELKELFDKYQLTAILMQKRSYTPKLDALFKRYPHLVHQRSTISYDDYYDMFLKDRGDFLIDYPAIANYLLTDKASDYVFLPINGLKKYELAYIGCSKTPFGKKVITEINTVLNDLKKSDVYQQAMSSWLTEKELNNDYYRFYKETFLTR